MVDKAQANVVGARWTLVAEVVDVAWQLVSVIKK